MRLLNCDITTDERWHHVMCFQSHFGYCIYDDVYTVILVGVTVSSFKMRLAEHKTVRRAVRS